MPVRPQRPEKSHQRRASKLVDADWARFKHVLCDQYRQKTLKEVIDFMKREYDFQPTQRQLSYRLELWNISKYSKNSTNRAEPDATVLVGDPPGLVDPFAPEEADAEHLGSDAWCSTYKPFTFADADAGDEFWYSSNSSSANTPHLKDDEECGWDWAANDLDGGELYRACQSSEIEDEGDVPNVPISYPLKPIEQYSYKLATDCSSAAPSADAMARPAPAPAWCGDVEPELGVSAAELLITMCRMIGDVAAASSSAPLDDDAAVLRRAQFGARIMARWTNQQLWTELIHRSSEAYATSRPGDEQRFLKDDNLDQVRQWIWSVLSLQLPIPTPQHATSSPPQPEVTDASKASSAPSGAPDVSDGAVDAMKAMLNGHTGLAGSVYDEGLFTMFGPDDADVGIVEPDDPLSLAHQLECPVGMPWPSE